MSGLSHVQPPTIAEVTIRPVVVPMPVPHTTSSGAITESPLILIDVRTEDDVTGHGILFTYTNSALRPTAEFLRSIAPRVIGQPLSPQVLTTQMEKSFRLLGAEGLVGMALAGLDMALWDAHARVQERSLVSLLGGVEKPIRAYAAVGFDGVDGCAEQAAQWAQLGFTGIKAKIGYPTVDNDLEVIQAMRDSTSDDMAIMVDYNQSLTPGEAIERIEVLDSTGLTWVEEPTLAHDFAGHAQVTRGTKTPIQCGENWWDAVDVKNAVAVAASDYIMLDPMNVGGVTGWMAASSIVEAANIPLSSHLWPELSARLLSCSPTAHWLEYCDWWNPILKNPLTIENGHTKIEASAGSGIEWNEHAVAEYAI